MRNGADNRKAFERGMVKAKRLIRNHLSGIGLSVMRDLLVSAISNYMSEGANLTGNTVTGFAAGMYVDGKCVEILKATEMGMPGATSSFARPGIGGFREYDSGEYVEVVYEYGERKGYRFQYVAENGTGEDSAVDFLRNRYRAGRNGISIVVCCGVPYAEYLANTRRLDVLISTRLETPSILSGHLKRMKG